MGEQLSISTIDQHLATLCQELNSDQVRLDADRESHLVGEFEGQEVTVSIAWREPVQVLMMRAAVVDIVDREMIESAQTLLLGLNLSPGDLLGACFALSPTDNTVYLVITLIGPELSYANFRVAFLRLFSLSSLWRGQLTSSPAFVSPHRHH